MTPRDKFSWMQEALQRLPVPNDVAFDDLLAKLEAAERQSESQADTGPSEKDKER